jgi:hypothetical protein
MRAARALRSDSHEPALSHDHPAQPQPAAQRVAGVSAEKIAHALRPLVGGSVPLVTADVVDHRVRQREAVIGGPRALRTRNGHGSGQAQDQGFQWTASGQRLVGCVSGYVKCSERVVSSSPSERTCRSQTSLVLASVHVPFSSGPFPRCPLFLRPTPTGVWVLEGAAPPAPLTFFSYSAASPASAATLAASPASSSSTRATWRKCGSHFPQAKASTAKAAPPVPPPFMMPCSPPLASAWLWCIGLATSPPTHNQPVFGSHVAGLPVCTCVRERNTLCAHVLENETKRVHMCVRVLVCV